MAVDFALSPDQEAIADVFGSFFVNESSPAVVRAAEPLGFSADLWTKVVSMDAPGMAVAVDGGGGGATMSDLVVVAETLGSALAPVPLIEHWVASRLLPAPDLLSGDTIGTVSLRPTDADGSWRLVPAGAVAHVVIGVDGDDVVAVRSEPPGVAPPNHGSSPLADRSARAGDRTVLGSAGSFTAALDEWRVLTGAALVGLAHQALRTGIDYVMERQQFGRPIGSYQAVQHELANMPALIEGAQFLAHKAAWAADEGLTGGVGVVDMVDGVITEFGPLAAMAFIQAADAAAVCTDRSLHFHGGYGFSLEYDIQLYFRRARGWANVLGDPARERLRLADLLWPLDGPAKAGG